MCLLVVDKWLLIVLNIYEIIYRCSLFWIEGEFFFIVIDWCLFLLILFDGLDNEFIKSEGVIVDDCRFIKVYYNILWY